jgi:ATP-dependent protease ClpP protease subunit
MIEIFVYDMIGPEWAGMVSAKGIVDQLDATAGQEVTLRVNSPGGVVDEAMAIYNAICRHGSVTAAVDGLAASAGSYITLAAKRVVIAENAIYMLHPVSGMAWGTADEIEKYLQMMKVYNSQTRAAYIAKADGKTSSEDVSQMFDEETWMTASEAVERGFADEIGQRFNGPSAKVPENMYRHAPANLVAHSMEQSRTELRNWVQAQRQLTLASYQTRIDSLKRLTGCH